MRKTFKYRIYPTQAQEATLLDHLRLCRRLYNVALEQRRWAWLSNRKTITFYDQSAELPLLKAEFPEFKSVYAQVLQNVLKRLDDTYRRFFNGKGFPRFKGEHRFRSFQYNVHGHKIKGKKLKLSGIGEVKIKLSRPIEGKIKTCTVQRESTGRWYVFFSCDLGESEVPARHIEREVGLDLGIGKFAALSDGSMVPNPGFDDRYDDLVASRKRAASRAQRGSANRKKLNRLANKAYAKGREARRDFHFKLANYLIQNYDRIFVEDLLIRNLLRSARGTTESPGVNVSAKTSLINSILSAGWGQFLEILRFKAESAGIQIIAVNPSGTSQKCSKCGSKRKVSLSDRVYRCECGLQMDRDWNAAINILGLGQSLVAAKA